MCLPFAAEGISARNADMKAYTIVWIPKLTPTVYLQRKDSFAAGEPFILLVGKPSAESTATGASVMLRLTPPDEIVTTGGTASGLVGILDRTYVPPTMYFERNILRNHTSITRLDGQSGYILRSQAPSSGTTYDLRLNTNTLVDAIRSPRINAGSEDAAYTLDGVRIDLKRLPAGSIYISGGKKILKR